VALQDTFVRTAQELLARSPDGSGLNPTLKSPFILIHPPLMFVAYALATVPAAAALAHFASGTNRWSRVAMGWSRVDWVVYTFAMGLGGMWAYYTLGFGGFWAWDPVEVANLLPWLGLTLYLHAQLHHARHGSFATVGPFLGLLPFLLTLFSAIATRSGLWVSVHAFTDPTNTFNPDAAARFLRILDLEPALRFYTGLMLATLALALALWSLRLARDHRSHLRLAAAVAFVLASLAAFALLDGRSAASLLLEVSRRATRGHTGLGLLALGFGAALLAAAPALLAKEQAPARPFRLDLRTLAFASVLVLGLSLLAIFLFHMAAVSGWTTGFYEKRLPYLATPALLGILVLQGLELFGRRRALAVAGATAPARTWWPWQGHSSR
ncbi:MAG TPA: cytochrome c biogenesis protein CcsA, partial [Candidatus Thermoplasmatota archaeon]|nr:cytochrome c biogenesis protein CcsA [Candidatus Thermoplasmatota archaeon]